MSGRSDTPNLECPGYVDASSPAVTPPGAGPALGDWIARRKCDGKILAWSAQLADLDVRVRLAGSEPKDVSRLRYYPEAEIFGGVEIEAGGETQ